MTQFRTIGDIYKSVDDDEKWVYICWHDKSSSYTSLISRFASRVHIHVSTSHEMIEIITSFEIEAQEKKSSDSFSVATSLVKCKGAIAMHKLKKASTINNK